MRGLEKNTPVESLKVNVLASREEGFPVDTPDLYAARPREAPRAVLIPSNSVARTSGLKPGSPPSWVMRSAATDWAWMPVAVR